MHGFTYRAVLCLLQACIQSSWACGFENECGVIWFSLLVNAEKPASEINSSHEMLLARAVGKVKTCFRSRLVHVMENLMCMVACRCVKRIERRGVRSRIMNVVIRIFLGSQTTPEERHEALFHISRRLFYIGPGVYNDCFDEINSKYSSFRFFTHGLMIRDRESLMMALRTMQFEVNHSIVSPSIPFISSPLCFPRPNKSSPVATMCVKAADRSSIITQPVFLRSMAKSVCPPEVWGVVSQNICYMPGVRNQVDVVRGVPIEQWTFHLHSPADKLHIKCDQECKVQCNLRSVHSLEDLCKLEVLRQLFNTRRARVLNMKRTKPFHAFRFHQS